MIADHIRHDPLHPYSVMFNWTTRVQRASEFMGSPPLHCYYLALVRSLGLGTEWWMHLWMLPFVVLSFFSVRNLDRIDDNLGVCLWASAPAVLVSATNLMPDISVAAFATLGAVLFFKRRFLLAGFVLALASMFRYNACAVLPGFAFYAIATGQRRGLLALLIPCVVLFGWFATAEDIAKTTTTLSSMTSLFRERIVAMPIFLLATTVCPISLLAVRLKRAEMVFALSLALACGYAAARSHVGGGSVPYLLVGCLVAGGAYALAAHSLRAFRRWRAAGDPFDLSLWLWVCAGLAIPVVYLQVSAKYMTAVVPPLAVLAARGSFAPRRLVWMGVGAWFLLGISLNIADVQVAGMYRDVALSSVRPGMWVTGHWGVQWYGKEKGGRTVSVDEKPAVGDTIMVLMQARLGVGDYTRLLRKVELIKEEERRSWWPLRLFNSDANAGWYSQYWGILPYSFSTVPLEHVYIARVLEVEPSPPEVNHSSRGADGSATPGASR